MKNDRVRCVVRWPVRGAVAVVGSGSDSPLNPTLVTRRMEFCMQTAAVFNLLIPTRLIHLKTAND